MRLWLAHGKLSDKESPSCKVLSRKECGWSQEGEGAELGQRHLRWRGGMGSKLFWGEVAGACNVLDEETEEGKTRKTLSHPA